MSGTAQTLNPTWAFRRTSSPHGQLLSACQYQKRVLRRSRAIAAVLGKGSRFHSDLVADLHRVTLPAASDKRVRRAKLHGEIFGRAAFIFFESDRDKRVRVDPVDLRNDSRQRRR